MSDEAAERIADELGRVVRGDVFSDILHRAAYSSDASIYRIVPRCVVAPRDVGDVAAVVEYARRRGVPMAARGAGSGLAGESLCGGIVLCMTRYMNKVVSVADDGAWAVCEPGVVLDELNACLADYGRKIGPDPSSSNRATVGGCVANNATGPHFAAYGYMAEHVESIEGVLADGKVAEFKNGFDPAVEQGAAGSVAKRCLAALSGKEAIISKALPRTRRNRSGYNIAGICHEGRIDLARLLTGSEGTLAVFTKIKLRTVKLAAAKALVQFEFDSLEQMAGAVPIIVGSGATTCELMDRLLIDMAVEASGEYRDILPAGAAAVLLVEQTGQTAEEAREKIEKTNAAVGSMASGRRMFFDESEQKRLWKSRKDAGPLVHRKRGRKHPAEFMEDTSVPNDRLGEYISGLEEIGKRYDFSASFYGHAGDGVLHLRPFMDLSEGSEVEKMRSIANEVYSLAWSLGGSISGEHADGLVRAGFVRRQYGDEFYELLCEIKKIFDPEGLMNPGKIISSDVDVMVKNLKAEPRYLPERLDSDLLFGKDELHFEVEQCYGCGLCLSRESDLRMCPVFRAVGEELGSSRAKANILHFWMTGQLGEEDFESPEFSRFLDLCVHCKACSVECPSGIDISRLMTQACSEYVKRKGLRRAEWVLSHNRYLSRVAGIFGRVGNLVMVLGAFRWVVERIAGLDRRRAMPRFERGSFLEAGRRFLAKQPPIEQPVDKVAYFVDTYANSNDHELGFAVLKVLRHNDIEVILPRQLPAPLPAIVYGDVKTARRDSAFIVEHLAEAVRQGYKVICSEPSAALCLKEELRYFVAGSDAKLVSENTYELMSYLLDLFKQGKLKPAELSQRQRLLRRYAAGNDTKATFVYHCPCHQRAVGDRTATIEVLRGLCGIEVVDVNAGCCGLAGTFGMQKKNYDLSSQMADGLAKALKGSSSRYVLTECSACRMQIEHISDKKATHPVKIIGESYGVK